MATTTIGIPSEPCQPFEIGSAGTLFEPSGVADTKLISSDERLIRELTSIIDSQLLGVLESRTAREFVDTRGKIWHRYVRSMRALSDTVCNLLSEDQIAIITELAIGALKEDLEKQRGSHFVETLVDQGLFTIWAMAKIRSLGRKIHEAGEAGDKDKDLKLNRDFQVYLLWTRFHMDCVVAAMKFRKSIPDDVQEIICEGLRAVVNTYAIMKEALRLRRPQLQKTLDIALPWDEEDDQLLASSMRDMNVISDSCDH